MQRPVAREVMRPHCASAPGRHRTAAAGAPFGTVEVNVEGAVPLRVSVCPTGALDDPERPTLPSPNACVQCGLCRQRAGKGDQPEAAVDFRAATAMSRIIKQEDPAECIRCGKPFGVKSSVERVVAKLEGKHWMYKDSKKRLDVIRMCDNCRVEAMAEEQFDPFGAPRRAPVRTTEDYFREREEKGDS